MRAKNKFFSILHDNGAFVWVIMGGFLNEWGGGMQFDINWWFFVFEIGAELGQSFTENDQRKKKHQNEWADQKQGKTSIGFIGHFMEIGDACLDFFGK